MVGVDHTAAVCGTGIFFFLLNDLNNTGVEVSLDVI